MTEDELEKLARGPWTFVEAEARGGALMTLRRDQFNPPSWQIWDASGDHLLAAFATRDLLYAGLPAIREYIKDRA